jgi:competence protein ComEC
MTLRLLCFSLGIILVGYLPELPSLIFSYSAFIVTATVLLVVRKKCSLVFSSLIFSVGCFVIGSVFGVAAGYYLLASQLPDEMAEKDIVVEGQVINLPQENDRRQLFTFKLTRAYSGDESPTAFENIPRKINISSYGDLRVKTGEHWRLVVKLKKPRGFVNPGGFDYQASLLRRGIGATGYIRQGDNRLLHPQPSFSLDVLRYELQHWLINTSHSPQKGILVALLVGDTSLVSKEQWGEMVKTGTNHLIAISGLHLGFFAIVGFFVGNLLGRCLQLVWYKYPSMISGYVCSIGFTLFYSIIAGFNIPTIRTLIMLAVVQLALLWRRTFRGRDTLLIALVLVLIYDPLAAYDIGFWLSFGAVAMLIFCFSGRISIVKKSTARQSYGNHFLLFLKSQWVMFVGLLIPLAVLIHTSSLLAPPANFIAIPVITFFVVPCVILAALCHFTVGILESFFLRCAELGMSLVHEWLNYLLTLGAGQLNPLVNINPWAVFLAMLGVVLILMPRGLGNKWVGYAGLIFALMIPLKKLPDLQMLVFDVGQGTAVLIRTPNHQLLYDTGPQYTENFDAGSGIIVPYLKSQGLQKIDTLVVSHNDKDHSGGLEGVLAAVDVNQLLLGELREQSDQGEPGELVELVELGPSEPKKIFATNTFTDKNKSHQNLPNKPKISNCHLQAPWQWDGVNFRFIIWPIASSAKANNHSCVLLVEFNGQKILLAGDIEKDVERLLVERKELSALDILLAPHHGSKTSSTAGFVAQVNPRRVIYSAGFHNQHGHPHIDVQARYAEIGSVPHNTAYAGALEFTWRGQQPYQLTQYRHSQARYWYDTQTQQVSLDR